MVVKKVGELSVIFPDDSEPINGKPEYLTFFNAIKKIGFEDVARLGHVHTRDYPPVMHFDNAIFNEAEWLKSPDGVYMVIKHRSSQQFKTILEGISEKLGCNLVVNLRK